MIQHELYGMNLQDVPEAFFHYLFDPEDRWPALVLASVMTVPGGNTDTWRLATQSCGGYRCEEFQAAVLPLKIRPELSRFLESVVDEDFSPAPLDYLNMMDAGQIAAVKEGYLSSLHSAGLSCDPQSLELLTQALYPVDATSENLKILSGDCIDLSQIDVSRGLVIFIVGQNCD